MIDIDDLFDRIIVGIDGRIAMKREEAELLARTVADSRLHVEIGCLWGASAILAALAGAERVFTIELGSGGYWDNGDPSLHSRLPTLDAVRGNFEAFGVADRVTLINANSHIWPLPLIEADTVFIDGDHGYEGLMRDWKSVRSLARRVLIHDNADNYPEIQRAIQIIRHYPGWKLVDEAGSLVVLERHQGPLVSVIVPTYNRPELLARALDSIADQTYNDVEIVVCNDNGEDVQHIVDQYPNALLVNHSENRGLPAARNTAIDASNGMFVSYLDDDDWYYRNHVQVLVDALATSDGQVAYTDAHAVERDARKRRVYCSRDFSLQDLHDHNLTPVCCVMHERDLLDEVGMFDESLLNHEDWDMWLRMAAVTDFIHIPTVTCAIDRTRRTMNSDRDAMIAGFHAIKQRYAHEMANMRGKAVAA